MQRVLELRSRERPILEAKAKQPASYERRNTPVCDTAAAQCRHFTVGKIERFPVGCNPARLGQVRFLGFSIPDVFPSAS